MASNFKLTYRQWNESQNRDAEPIMVSTDTPYRVYYDRFFKLFVFPDEDKVVTLEEVYRTLMRK